MPARRASEASTRTMMQRLMRSIARRPRAFALGITIALIGAVWVMLGAFVAWEYNEAADDSRSDLNVSQQSLATYFSTNYATARGILGTADEWIARHPETTDRTALDELGRFIGGRQHAAGQTELVLLVDANGNKQSIAAASAGHPATTSAHLDQFGITPDAPAAAAMMGLAGYDPIARSDAIPVLRKASPNRLGIAYLETLIRIRSADEPFTNLRVEWSATFGLERPDRTVVFAWPEGSVPLGMQAPAVANKHASNKWRTVEFPGHPPLLFNGVPLDGAAGFAVFSTLRPGAIWERTAYNCIIPVAIVLVGSAVLLGLSMLITQLLRLNEVETARTRRALAAAQAASVAKTQFLANMSHELRTPLNAIIGFSEVISSELFGPVGNARYVDYSQHVLHAGRHLLELIQNVLDMARIEAGQIKVGDSSTGLAEILANVEELLAARLATARVRLDSTVPADCPHILIEPLHLKQLLINIIGNAAKFSTAGTAVTVSINRRFDGSLAIKVTDTGIGIPNDKIEELFQPFVQAENGLARNHDGIGLGLTISKAIIDAYGGSIEIQSHLNVGTTVTLIFPKDRVQENPPALAAADTVVTLRAPRTGEPTGCKSDTAPARAANDRFGHAGFSAPEKLSQRRL